jgi:signal-transduction protein with cAMP-binding, CBS, and nucleotidyltransferase domain
MPTISIGELMTVRLETIDSSSSAQQASKKMMEKNVSSLVVIHSNNNNSNKPMGIVTERDLVRKVCLKDASSSNIQIKNIMSSFPLITIDARSSVGAAADVMIQNKVRHLLVIEENNDKSRPLGIITPTDFVGYLKEDLNIDDEDVNAKILESLKGGEEVVEELEQQGKLQKGSQKGGEEYEDEEPRQG